MEPEEVLARLSALATARRVGLNSCRYYEVRLDECYNGRHIHASKLRAPDGRRFDVFRTGHQMHCQRHGRMQAEYYSILKSKVGESLVRPLLFVKHYTGPSGSQRRLSERMPITICRQWNSGYWSDIPRAIQVFPASDVRSTRRWDSSQVIPVFGSLTFMTGR